ncbi:MAG TPA: hypothetical protein VK985_05875 [Rariglobus sp.]|nr:hypothetical protein [Rariglobus sp.]
MRSIRSRLRFTSLVLATVTSLMAAKPITEFGSAEASSASLVGILYDLKQDQARKPMKMDIPAYGKLVDEFISKGWDEGVLNRYFRAARPLYTTQVFIPLMSAGAAPKAFEVENIVKPMFWLIHYKGQVSAPTTGAWRFWGYGEEVCSVAINGKNVLLSNWKEITTPSVKWKSPEPPGQPAASGHLKAGDWIELKAGQVVDIDVLIGERGGGVFASYLLIEKRGDAYAMLNGKPILPVFQLAPYDTPQPESVKYGPVIATKGPIWKAVQ